MYVGTWAKIRYLLIIVLCAQLISLSNRGIFCFFPCYYLGFLRYWELLFRLYGFRLVLTIWLLPHSALLLLYTNITVSLNTTL